MANLLDSDVVIDLLASEPNIVALVRSLAPAGLAMSAVTYMEAYQGVRRGVDPVAEEAALQDLVASFPVLPFTATEARRCALIREELRRQGRRTESRSLDLLVAATAIEAGFVLVTRNTRDYRGIPNFRLLDANAPS